jgi:hypothetical protein
VYPREVVKEALRLNAAAVIVSHNHPSGNPEPSAADRALTQRLKEALALVDVRTLDHVIVAKQHHVIRRTRPDLTEGASAPLLLRPASATLALAGLRARLPKTGVRGGVRGRRSCCSLHRAILAVKGCACLRACGLAAVVDP